MRLVTAKGLKVGDALADSAGRKYTIVRMEPNKDNIEIEFCDGLVDLYAPDTIVRVYD